MGQSSSQVEPSQLGTLPEIDSSNEGMTLPTSVDPETKSKKRNLPAAEAEDENPRPNKISRSRKSDATAERSGSRRSKPQHLRGTAILPSEEIEKNTKAQDCDEQRAKQHVPRKERIKEVDEHNNNDAALIKKRRKARTAPRVPRRSSNAVVSVTPVVADNVMESYRRHEADVDLQRNAYEEYLKLMDTDVEFTAAYEREHDEAKRTVMMDDWIVANGPERQFPLRSGNKENLPKSETASQKKSPVATGESQAKQKSLKKRDKKATKRAKQEQTLKRIPSQVVKGQARQSANDTQEPSTAAATVNKSSRSRRRTEKASTIQLADPGPMHTPPVSLNRSRPRVSDVRAVATAANPGQEVGYDPTARIGYVDASDQVAEWVTSQTSPAPRVEMCPPLESPLTTRKRVKSSDRTTSKRKGRKLTEKSDDPRDDIVESGAQLEVFTNSKSKQKQEKAKTAGETSDIRGTVSGAWSKDEIALADTTFETCRSMAGLSAHEMKGQIAEWKAVGMFKEDIFVAFPLRTKTAIRKFCQRRYHPLSTGAWTPDEDDILKKKVATLGKSWVAISAHVGRTAQACKDRWDHHLQHETTMESGPWTVKEEEELTKAVAEALKLIRDDCSDAEVRNDPTALAEMIHWNKIAETLHGKRSAKRCREKWHTIRQRPLTAEDAMLQLSVEDHKPTKKQERLDAAYSRLGWQDVLDAVIEIINALAKESDAKFSHESTVWSVVSMRLPDSHFPPKLRRKCYLEMLEKFGSLPKMKDAEGIVAKARVIKGELLKLQKLERKTYKSSLPTTLRKKQSKKASARREKPLLSAEYVDSSDEDGDIVPVR